MRHSYLLLILLLGTCVRAQSAYFPPAFSAEWETTRPADLGWDAAALPALYDYLGDNNTKAFLILYDGRIVVEEYFDNFTRDSLWYWASAGKTITTMAVGRALDDGLLSLDDPANQYLGVGWTACGEAEENRITVRDQLQMTTAMNDLFGNCEAPACLRCVAEPGTRWSYHNAPYRKLRGVVEAATGTAYNPYVQNTIMTPIGGAGRFIISDTDLLYFSTPRTMARFGLLMLNNGNWAGTQVQNSQYLREATTPSQSLNPSYGYLWWLNGQPSYRVPGSQDVFNGPLTPSMPADGYSALGKNGQMLDVIPSRKLVVVRMGNAWEGLDTANQVTTAAHEELWARLSPILDGTTATTQIPTTERELYLSPNPTEGSVYLRGPLAILAERVSVLDATGKLLFTQRGSGAVDLGAIPAGSYLVIVQLTGGQRLLRRVVRR